MKWQFGEPISQRSAAISGALFGTAFPKSYLKHVPANNGGCPEKRFFDTKTTKGRVVAYFLSTKMELEDPESLFHYARNDKAYFEKVAKKKECTLLVHEINKGKGRALKTAFSYCEGVRECCGVITVDGDELTVQRYKASGAIDDEFTL